MNEGKVKRNWGGKGVVSFCLQPNTTVRRFNAACVGGFLATAARGLVARVGSLVSWPPSDPHSRTVGLSLELSLALDPAQTDESEDTEEDDHGDEDQSTSPDGDIVEALVLDDLLAGRERTLAVDKLAGGAVEHESCRNVHVNKQFQAHASGEKRTIEFVEGDASIRILDEAQSIEPREVRRQLGGRKEEATIQTTDLFERMRA